MRELLFDIETDGFLEHCTTIHSLVIEDFETGEVWDCADQPGYVPIKEGLKLLTGPGVRRIGHNIINYDIPVIHKLYPEFDLETEGETFDTIVASRVIWPNVVDTDMVKIRSRKLDMPLKLAGQHSLEAWGYRLGRWKGDYSKMMEEKGLDPWAEWNVEMQEYCVQDVVVTREFYRLIRQKKYSQQCLDLEHGVAWAMAQMMRNGFRFNKVKANKLLEKLLTIRAELADKLLDIFPPKVEKIPFTPKANNSKLGYVKGVPTFKTKTTVFNPNSRDQIADRLITVYKWKPKEFTPGGKPKVDETTLGSLKYPEAKQLAYYMTIQKRIGQLAEGDQAWFNHVKEDSRIYGRITTNGAVTGRATHSSPNMGQVPSADAEFGHECRELFEARPGFKLLGCDVSGLELRMLGHFMWPWDDGAYADIVVNGDVHTVNQEAAGLPTRAKAKRFIYAFLYGAGDELIGELVEGGKKEGKAIKNQFYEGLPALKSLIEWVQGEVVELKPLGGPPPKGPDGKVDWRTFKQIKGKWYRKVKTKEGLKGLDGRVLHSRSEHSALNLLLQSAGAIVCKQWIVEFDRLLKEHGLHNQVFIVAWVHDELQMEVADHLVEETYDAEGKLKLRSRVGDICIEAIRIAGEKLGIKVALTGEYNIGQHWADTH